VKRAVIDCETQINAADRGLSQRLPAAALFKLLDYNLETVNAPEFISLGEGVCVCQGKTTEYDGKNPYRRRIAAFFISNGPHSRRHPCAAPPSAAAIPGSCCNQRSFKKWRVRTRPAAALCAFKAL